MITHLVLFAGGINEFSNYARYPADLSLILSSLSGFAGLTSAQITVLSGPGGTDFQFDGNHFQSIVATKSELRNSIARIANTAVDNDRFLFVASNHGGQRVSGSSSSTLYCWQADTVTPAELRSWCSAVACSVQIFVMGQCYSGGFIEELSQQGRAIMTACTFNELSYASTANSERYDEFIYRIAEALVARAPTVGSVFQYAQNADREKETPQFSDGGLAARLLWEGV